MSCEHDTLLSLADCWLDRAKAIRSEHPVRHFPAVTAYYRDGIQLVVTQFDPEPPRIHQGWDLLAGMVSGLSPDTVVHLTDGWTPLVPTDPVTDLVWGAPGATLLTDVVHSHHGLARGWVTESLHVLAVDVDSALCRSVNYAVRGDGCIWWEPSTMDLFAGPHHGFARIQTDALGALHHLLMKVDRAFDEADLAQSCAATLAAKPHWVPYLRTVLDAMTLRWAGTSFQGVSVALTAPVNCATVDEIVTSVMMAPLFDGRRVSAAVVYAPETTRAPHSDPVHRGTMN